jgi:hypothetical protein
MTSKILRSGGTEITGIKSVIYTEKVNAGTNLRPGCVASAYIDVEVYGSQSAAPGADEALTYYQVDSEGNETLIGIFYAEPSVPSRNTYKFTAYDAVSKLDKPYSERLNAIQADFPMSIYDLVSDACSVADVTLGSSSWPLSTQSVEAFYADGLTCRNILQYAAEIAGRFVRCNTSGEVIFDWYTTASTGITPGTTTGNVPFKQGGLTYDNFTVMSVDAVAIKPAGTEGAAYIYPTSYGTVTATDPNGDGNVILQNLVVTDDGNGNLYLSVGAEDDNGNVEITQSASASNTLILSGNLLLTNATEQTYTAAAQNVYQVMSSLPAYRHAVVQLFNFLNPFRAGQFVSITDAQGVSFTAPIFEMRVQASGAEIKSSGKQSYEDTEQNTVAKTLANLANNIVQIDKLKVNWADIDTAVINTLETNDITAKNLTVIDDDGNVVATYSGNVVIGKDDETHLEIDFNSLKLIDKEGNVYFYVSDLRDETGYAEVTNRFTGDGQTTTFRFSVAINQIVSVTIDGVDVPSSDYTTTRSTITFTTAPADSSSIVVVYKSDSPYLKAFSFGQRNSVVGLFGYAEGSNVRASGEVSHAEGADTTASGGSSHAEGLGTTASGEASHAEGLGTIAGGNNQHAGGQYNIEDTNNTYAEIIGNGIYENNRSNARTLDWHGNEWLAGGLTINGSTDVGAILTALTADSGWTSLNPLYYRKVGNIVYLTSNALSTAVSSIPATTWTTICTLPSGFRPDRRIDAAASLGYNADVPGAIRIGTGGVVEVWASAAVASPYITFSTSYPV